MEKEEYYSINNISRITRLLISFLITKWWLFIIAIILGICIGFGISSIQKPKYEAVSTFVLEEKSAGAGGLAGLASQFGLDIGGMSSGGSIFAGDNILDILRSRKIIQKVLLSKVGEGNKPEQVLADYFLDYSGWRKKWTTEGGLNKINYKDIRHIDSLNLWQDSVLNIIYDYIIEKSLYADRLNKKGTIIKVQITESDPLFAKLMTKRLVDEAGKLYLDIKTGTSTANINKMQRRADSLLALLNSKSYSVAASQMLDLNPGIRTATVPTEIGTRDKTVLATVYSEVTKNLEASKLILSQQTPIIQILDKPEWPLVDKRTKLLKLCLISVVATTLILVFILGIQFIVLTLPKSNES
ncbi:Wzz/FepE/Etk N-terminal domain-containing protein [Paracnuella aquatica]|uniref:Wzz/FepE/Etk N-terminal domain-containing protein n=1 Tax=Paracnuella aquatica TaxID=2268757 RepID=UPI0013900C9E|nr:Wzz/FepE/Etk N-terminal domain-containing protein [Paracnuella aquatica]